MINLQFLISKITYHLTYPPGPVPTVQGARFKRCDNSVLILQEQKKRKILTYFSL